MDKIKVVAVVIGGVVQSAYSSTSDIDFEVLDIDNIKEEGLDDDEEFKMATEGLKVIY